MKVIYIAGLGHSGTTLLNQLLTQSSATISLGEVAVMFSPEHMNAYKAKWGHTTDYCLCSCGKKWSECKFWSELEHLSGLKSSLPVPEKYKILIDHIRSRHGDDSILVDSSKSIPAFESMLAGARAAGLKTEDCLLVHCVRDVRGFASSHASRRKERMSFVDLLRTFNLWLGSNREFDGLRERHGSEEGIVLYEKLCANPAAVLNPLLRKVGLTFDNSSGGGLAQESHIAMGNKAFTQRNRDRIKYDMRWFADDRIETAYLLHRSARSYNKLLYSRSLGKF
ncbi:MAG: sulfotransferase [Thermomonas sp.]|uniref:sulfotransferase n=1 Tax=Thermomonas sp. TaxID=1971895 RepID=UPI001D5A56D9|nr:sulfotransferase [Thermomonas sp.]MBZ0087665.1 sulfotransferase [Thermomonas sp.]